MASDTRAITWHLRVAFDPGREGLPILLEISTSESLFIILLLRLSGFCFFSLPFRAIISPQGLFLGYKEHLISKRLLFSSVAQSCPTLCNSMDCSTPSFTVHPQLLELAQIHVHQVSDAIQPSHALLSPSPPALDLHQGLFK